MAKVLLVEDDQELAAMLQSYLEHQHHAVEVLYDGSTAANHLKTHPYDIIILDWMLPGISGIDICQEFRARGGQTPVLILTGKGAAHDKVIGLDAGADDYLSKPFNTSELAARLRALLRRTSSVVTNQLTAGSITLDPDKHLAFYAGEVLQLLPKEFALLEFLMRHPNRVYSAEVLFNHVWSSESVATNEAVRSTVKRLRKKLEVCGSPDIIDTVYGVGYILKC